MLLKKVIKIESELECITGLRIGGSSDTLEIGGNDNPIIRHSITDEPYIPGSSLKGKMRSLLEGVYGRKNYDKFKKQIVPRNDGKPCGCGSEHCKICKTFGPHMNQNHKLGPTRILFRDASLTKESLKLLNNARIEKGLNFSEVKNENTIDRINNTANPRPFERVPSGTKFYVEMILKIYDTDDEPGLINFVKQGIELLENDYLGSSGSRGYGKIKFTDLKFIEMTIKKV